MDYGFEGTKYPGYGLPVCFVEDYDEYLKINGHPGLRQVKVKNLMGHKDFPEVTMPIGENGKDVGTGAALYCGIMDLPSHLTPAGYAAKTSINFLRQNEGKGNKNIKNYSLVFVYLMIDQLLISLICCFLFLVP